MGQGRAKAQALKWGRAVGGATGRRIVLLKGQQESFRVRQKESWEVRQAEASGYWVK